MSSWKKHLIIGTVIEVLFLVIVQLKFKWFEYTVENGLILFGLLFISPLILDLDHRHGKLREVMTYIGLVIGLIGVAGYYFKLEFTIFMVIGIVTSSLAYLSMYFTKHRGFTHTISFCALYGLILYLFFEDVVISLYGFIGNYTHLILDGIPFRFWSK